MNALEISAKRRIDKQRRQTPQQDPIELQCALQDLGPDADHTQQRRASQHHQHQQRSQQQSQSQARSQSLAPRLPVPCPKRLRNQGIQPGHSAQPEDRHAVKKRRADTGGTDCQRAVRQPTHHDVVDDRHGHPAKFGQCQRHGNAQHRANIVRDAVAGHD